MPTLAWTRPNDDAAVAEATVMASCFELRAISDVPAFFLAALRIRRQMLRSPGVLGVSLIARPLAKTFYTLSAWESRAALDAAVAAEPHVTSMSRFRSRMARSWFVFWTAPGTIAPRWPEAHRRLAAG